MLFNVTEQQPSGDFNRNRNECAISGEYMLATYISSSTYYIYAYRNGARASLGNTDEEVVFDLQNNMAIVADGDYVYLNNLSIPSTVALDPDGSGVAKNWKAVAIDGEKMVAGVSGGRLYYYDGTSRSEIQPAGNVNKNRYRAKISGDKILVTDAVRLYYYDGTSRSEIQPAGNVNKNRRYLSIDGDSLLAGELNGGSYISTDGAVSWSTTLSLNGLISDDNFVYMGADGYYGSIYSYGTGEKFRDGTTLDLAVSLDSNKFLCGTYGGRLYLYELFLPSAEFSSNVQSANETDRIDFIPEVGANGGVLSWAFGDTSTSTKITPTHIYVDSGVYDVSLTYTNKYGTDTITKNNYITITEPTYSTRYWVGGSGVWNLSDTTNRSLTSGGDGGASVPTQYDDVIFDTNSGPSVGDFIISSDVEFDLPSGTVGLVCKSLTINVGRTIDMVPIGDITISVGVFGNVDIINVNVTDWGVLTLGRSCSIINAPLGLQTQVVAEETILANNNLVLFIAIIDGVFDTNGYNMNGYIMHYSAFFTIFGAFYGGSKIYQNDTYFRDSELSLAGQLATMDIFDNLVVGTSKIICADGIIISTKELYDIIISPNTSVQLCGQSAELAIFGGDINYGTLNILGQLTTSSSVGDTTTLTGVIIGGGGILTWSLSNIGSGYSVNDTLYVSSDGSSGEFIVTSIDGSGGITGLTLTTPGTKHTTGINDTYGSVGIGATIEVLTLSVLEYDGDISKSEGIVDLDYITLISLPASGGATFYAGSHSTDGGGNTGWLFEDVPTLTRPFFLLNFI